MAVDKTTLGNLLFCFSTLWSRCGTSKDIFLFVCLIKFLPKCIFIFYFSMNKIDSWSTRNSGKSFTCCASLDPLITTEYLCPSFFKQEHPNFFVGATATECPIIFDSRPGEIVVNYHFSTLTIYEESYGIAPCVIHIFGDKETFYSLWKLSHWRESRKEITVTAITLLDVCWVNFVVDLEVSSSPDLRGSSPDIGFPLLSMLSLPFHQWIEQRGLIGLEKWVFPWLSLCNDSLVINLLESCS